jgi:hypothetical protein
MAHVEGLDLERANPEGFTGLDGMQIGFICQAVASQFDLDQAARERRGIDRGHDRTQQVLDACRYDLRDRG